MENGNDFFVVEINLCNGCQFALPETVVCVDFVSILNNEHNTVQLKLFNCKNNKDNNNNNDTNDNADKDKDTHKWTLKTLLPNQKQTNSFEFDKESLTIPFATVDVSLCLKYF